jgi:hypothetical protein
MDPQDYLSVGSSKNNSDDKEIFDANFFYDIWFFKWKYSNLQG